MQGQRRPTSKGYFLATFTDIPMGGYCMANMGKIIPEDLPVLHAGLVQAGGVVM